MGAVASQIFLQRVHFGPFYVYSIVPRPTTPPIWQMFQVLLVYFDHNMHICKVSGCANHGPIDFFNVVLAYFYKCYYFLAGMEIGHGNMTCWPEFDVEGCR